MNFEDGLVVLVLVMLAVAFGFAAIGADEKEDSMIQWVEDCWPNKPVWSEETGTCWVNGQKVVP